MELPADIAAMATPAPPERLEGLVIAWTPTYGWIRANRTDYLAIPSAIEPDGLGRRYLVVNEPVTFRPALRGFKKLAMDIRPAWREMSVEDLEAHREEVRLRFWDADGQFGFADRELGGALYVSARAIVSTGVETLKKGSRLWCGVEPPPVAGKAWAATNVQLIDEVAS